MKKLNIDEVRKTLAGFQARKCRQVEIALFQFLVAIGVTHTYGDAADQIKVEIGEFVQRIRGYLL